MAQSVPDYYGMGINIYIPNIYWNIIFLSRNTFNIYYEKNKKAIYLFNIITHHLVFCEKEQPPEKIMIYSNLIGNLIRDLENPEVNKVNIACLEDYYENIYGFRFE